MTRYRITTPWDIEIETRDPIATQLAVFDRHKKALLDKLRDAYERGPKSKPFDSNKSWRDLTRIATFYFSEDAMKQNTIAAGTRVKRLGEIAKVLGCARRLADKAMQDDVGGDLFRALAAERGITVEAVLKEKHGASALTRLADEMKKMLEGLAALESAAIRAAKQVTTKPGRPKGTSILPPNYILGLARAYRESTGSTPGAGPGPFARWVYAFLDAVGRKNCAYASVIDAIKDARVRAPMLLAANRWGPSPFEVEA